MRSHHIFRRRQAVVNDANRSRSGRGCRVAAKIDRNHRGTLTTLRRVSGGCQSSANGSMRQQPGISAFARTPHTSSDHWTRYQVSPKERLGNGADAREDQPKCVSTQTSLRADVLSQALPLRALVADARSSAMRSSAESRGLFTDRPVWASSRRSRMWTSEVRIGRTFEVT
jgi:hypothetical protein